MSRRTAIAAVAIGCAGIAGGAWYAWRQFALSAKDDAASTLLRSLTLPDAQGQPYPLANLAGKVVVLNFWATWCPPCIDEMPELAGLHREIAPRQGTVIGIGIDSPTNIREFASKHQFPYPLLVGGMGGSELSRRFGNLSEALPYTVVIGSRGQVAHRVLGRIKLPALRQNVLAQLA